MHETPSWGLPLGCTALQPPTAHQQTPGTATEPLEITKWERGPGTTSARAWVIGTVAGANWVSPVHNAWDLTGLNHSAGGFMCIFTLYKQATWIHLHTFIILSLWHPPSREEWGREAWRDHSAVFIHFMATTSTCSAYTACPYHRAWHFQGCSTVVLEGHTVSFVTSNVIMGTLKTVPFCSVRCADQQVSCISLQAIEEELVWAQIVSGNGELIRHSASGIGKKKRYCRNCNSQC